MDGARAGGLDLTFDSYQYSAAAACSTPSYPDWIHAGGPDVEIERLALARCRAGTIRRPVDAATPDLGADDPRLGGHRPATAGWRARASAG